MFDSPFYQKLYREAELEGAQQVLLRFGEESLGPPDSEALNEIRRINNFDLIVELAINAEHAQSWRELLAPTRRLKSLE